MIEILGSSLGYFGSGIGSALVAGTCWAGTDSYRLFGSCSFGVDMADKPQAHLSLSNLPPEDQMMESNDSSLCLSGPKISAHKLVPQTDCCRDSLVLGKEFGLFVCFFDLEQKSGSVAEMPMSRRVLFVAVVDSFGFACY